MAGHPEETLAENVYDELGQLVQKKVGNNPDAPLQTVDYSYNIRGWLQQINDVNNIGNDLFGFQIHYNDPTAGIPLYNGNISQTRWRTNNTDNSLKHYTYSYDALNRITGATHNTGNYNLNGITYDKSGNILSLNRQGRINEAADNFGVMDDLVYSYDSGNKLLKVEDLANDTYGFKDDAVAVADNSDDYSYDVNGNMISDTNKGITSIIYNHLNLPIQVTINGQDILYIYDAAGIKQRKVFNGTTTDYAGNYIYENGSLKTFNHAEGYIKPDGAGGYDYVYNYKDQVNNVRLSYADFNNDGAINPVTEILQERNYYPFGLQHKGYNNVINGDENKYKTFQEQELNDELGLNWISFKWRNHDPATGRFFNIDPLADKYRFNSPYAFSENRVVNGVELEGLEYASYSYNGKYQEKISKATAQQTKEERDEANSMKLDVIPGIGDGKGLVEAFTGKDLVTGQKLGWGSRLLGLVFLSELRPFAKLADAYRGLKVAGKGALTGFENSVVKAVEKNGDQIIAAGDLKSGQTLSAISLGIGGEKAADILSVSSSGKFNLTEVKGVSGTIDDDLIDPAIKQLTNTATALKNKVNGAKIGEINLAVPKGTKFGGTYSVSGNQLVRNTDAGQEVVRIQGQVVNVRFVNQ